MNTNFNLSQKLDAVQIVLFEVTLRVAFAPWVGPGQRLNR